MIRIFFYFIIILFSNSLYSQNADNIYVELDDHNLFKLSKQESYGTLKIPYYKNKNTWLKDLSKPKNSNDDIVKVTSNNNEYFEFYSLEKPIKISDINNLNIFKVKDVSTENPNVWKKYPYTMFFLEKINCDDYLVWKMALKIQE